MTRRIGLGEFEALYSGVVFVGMDGDSPKIGELFTLLVEVSWPKTDKELIWEANACCGITEEIGKSYCSNFKTGGGDARRFWRFFFYLHLTQQLSELVADFDREKLGGKTFQETVGEPLEFVDLRQSGVAQSPDQSQVSGTNFVQTDPGSDEQTLVNEFLEDGVPRGLSDFIEPSGPWRIKFHSQKPETEDHNFLYLEAAGHNMNTDKRFGVFVNATLMERNHNSGYVIGYRTARIAVRIRGEKQGIVEFNQYLRKRLAVGDAGAVLVGDGPTSVIELDANAKILNGRYSLPEIAFVLRPSEEQFELQASLYTLPSDETLRKRDGSELPSRVKSEIISVLLSRAVHPDDDQDGRLHLVHQTYNVQFVE